MDLANKGMSAEAEFLLFSASRAQLVRQVMRPHLEVGGVVVCDRFADSSLAYQGYGHKLDLASVRVVNTLATGGLIPDLTFLLDIPVDEGLRRRREHGAWNRLDDYDLEFHQRVRHGYLSLVKQDPDRWVIVDATKGQTAVQEEMRGVMERRAAGPSVG
jgi:dTMP kinase